MTDIKPFAYLGIVGVFVGFAYWLSRLGASSQKATDSQAVITASNQVTETTTAMLTAAQDSTEAATEAALTKDTF